MSYRVSTQVYSGPFDLLLQLVSRQKVDIGSISISEVAEQYLAEVERLEALDLDVASDFLLVAATLLDIKAASLVPDDSSNVSEDDDLDDEFSGLDADSLREVLIQRLIAYKQFKGAAAALGARMEAESRMHPRVAGPDPEFLNLMPDYLAGITLRGLAVICADLDGKRETFLLEAEHVAPSRVPIELTVASVDRVTAGITLRGLAVICADLDGKRETFLLEAEHVAPSRVPIELTVASVDRVTISRPHLTFRDLLDGDATTEQIVATFLAILELSKRGSVTLEQDENFGTIRIDRVAGAPEYRPEDGSLFDEED